MKDILGQKIYVEDTVCFAPSGAYSGIKIGKVEKFTEKRVCIVADEIIEGRHMKSEKYYAPPKQIVVLRVN